MNPTQPLGRCVPCERLAGLGQSSARPSPIKFDLGRDLTSGAVALGAPWIYHVAAPKKWKRVGLVGNLVAVVALYFGTAYAYAKIKEKL